VKQEPELWLPVLQGLIKEHPRDTEEEITWKLIETIGVRAASILAPVYEKHKGQKGKLSLQVNPKYYGNAERMVAHARQLAALAPNVAIKVPCTEQGVIAVEELTALGITVNMTVSFTVAQAVASAEAIERGWKRAAASGVDVSRLTPYVTIMVGRLDDHLKRVMAKEKISIDPGCLEWAGVAAFKKSYSIFQAKGYRSTLLSAAYRNHMHWSSFLGGKVVLSMPYDWWTRFNNSAIEVKPRMDEPVPPEVVDTLYRTFAEFRRAYDEGGLAPAEFQGYGATVHTLHQFIAGYSDLLAYVRDQMIR